jgi:hypothetical protein
MLNMQGQSATQNQLDILLNSGWFDSTATLHCLFLQLTDSTARTQEHTAATYSQVAAVCQQHNGLYGDGSITALCANTWSYS